jgi:predicted phosphodiesterase
MRLGLVTDIHNHARELARALDLFGTAVDQVVTLGDTCDAFARSDGAAEVAALLEKCGAVGVWGNHDYTLCRDISADARSRFPRSVLDFMAGMQPRLTIGECHFSHKEASADPNDVAQLWEISDVPLNLLERARLGFQAIPHRWQITGHYHRWWAATLDGPLGWDGTGPLVFDPIRRYFVVIAAVCEGWCGILDTTAGTLEPVYCGDD